MHLYTAHWFAKLPDTIQRVGISRGTPRGQPGGYRMYRDLAPGTWFNQVSPGEYLERYNAILAKLDPEKVVADLEKLGNGKDVAMLCFESPTQIAAGTHWCHRHIAAQWLRDTTGADIVEFAHPELYPWKKLDGLGVKPPRYDSQLRF